MKTALVIPIHPPHYHYLYTLLDMFDLHNIKIDTYLIFSNNNDYNAFQKKDKIKHIIVPPKRTNNIVIYKKWYALDVLKDNTEYDYFIACDAEVTIIPENFNETNIINKINSIYSNKLIYAGETNDATSNRIIQISANLISKDNRLQMITKNYTLYYWWSDIPVYKREHISDFFGKLDFYNFNWLNINWNYFDHIIYLNYLILYHDFKMLNVSPLINHNWSLESYNTNNTEHLNILAQNNYGFSYIIKRLYDSHREFMLKQGSFLLYHLDR